LPKKKGFTLVEMMVVMGIMAVLSVIGIGTILSTRGTAEIDSLAQGLLDQIRETQNRSMAITKNSSGDIPVVWGLRIRADGYDVLSYYPDKGNGNKITPSGYQSSVNFTGNTSITINKNGSPLGNGQTYLDYTSPFGKLYFSTWKCGEVGVTCVWNKNKNLTGDYEPSTGSLLSNSTETMSFVISDGKNSKTITVTGNGDSYAN
jgi:prepilin-type N-terminal cleavage/methylation domain-containing protein